jgi:hypothetical protein
MTGCPRKLVPIAFELPLGGVSEKSSSVLVIHTIFHLISRSPIPLYYSGHRVGQLFRGCTLPCGKNGLKGVGGESS